MTEVTFLNNEMEYGVRFTYEDGSKMEYSFSKQEKTLTLSRYHADEDVPSSTFTISKLPEIAEFAKLLNLPEMKLELA
jgi:hypothetical protein